MIELLHKQKLLSGQLQVLRDQLMLAECQIEPLQKQIDQKVSELIQVTEQMRVPPPTYGRKIPIGRGQETAENGTLNRAR